ncbi:MAG: CPBP family intramembrane metalloprotease [Anaerolineales bacterium]|nr:CPBP family intramembrane metalloprotease [Anaerolineales bacterium]
MSLATPIPTEPAPAPRARWLDILLVVAVGLSVFIFTTGLIGYFLQNANTTLLVAAITLANFFSLGGSVVLLGLWRGWLSLADLGLWPVRFHWAWLIVISGVTVLLLPLRLLLAYAALILVEGNLDSLSARQELLGTEFSLLGFIVTFIGVGLLVPISEELFFRGALYTWFRRRFNFWTAVIVSSVLFGLAHFDSLGVVLSSLVMGVAIAVVFEYTRSLYTAIGIHMLNNSLAVFLLYLLLGLMELFPQLKNLQP